MGQPGQFRKPRSHPRLARSRPDHPDSASDSSPSVIMISLDHEISSSLDPTHSGRTARTLVDEFGLDIDDQESDADGRYGSDGREGDHDSGGDDDEHVVDRSVDFMIDRLDTQLDLDLADPFDLDPSSLPVQGQSLGDELAYGAFDPCISDYPTSFLLDEFNLGTDSKNGIDNQEHMAPRDSFGDSMYPFHEPTSPPCSPISSSSSSLDSASSTPFSASSSLSTLLSQIILPPSFLPLLRKDDQSFVLESALKAFALKIEASARQREGMNTERNTYNKDERKRFAGGLDHRSVDFSSLAKKLAGYTDPCPSILDDFSSSSSTLDGFSSPAVHQTFLAPIQSPPTPAQPINHSADPLILGDSPSPFSSPSRPSPSSSSYVQSTIRRVEELRFLTDSLISSLSTVGDTSQITLSGATEAGRRLRSIRTTLGGIKAEEASWERSREEIQSWEDQKEKRVNLKAVMRTELDGFRKAMEDFEQTKTTTIRTTHEDFLRGTYV
ncbi:hypothetical protein [Phaffia rhodozyma]|uniref:Uncharacterized protein n=1 Tax=Phaffia rhodozyma TaxID=264483 RepID=A0A0F7SGQ7_PHARH|nr:hypothetical protein [Phaffia rhodozyma]